MFRIKKLYLFVLQTFFPILLATFTVCLFIILMQFLWKYVDEMVGKGLEMSVLAEMFFYAALAFVPMALPLAILLASLMTFGNLGESLELLAVKSAGVSLLKIMRPLIILILLIAGGAFYFQNNILPVSQVKMYTLLWSMKQKSPELDIPEGVFYQEITKYNVYVEYKDKKTGILHNMMIYDFSDGFENAKVYVADSGKLASSADKKSLVLTLYHGESFENFKTEQRASVTGKSKKSTYMRQTFDMRQVLIEFDANFKMMDESMMAGKDISKNLNQLRHSIDSMKIGLNEDQQAAITALRSHSFREVIEVTKPDTAKAQTVIADTSFIKSFDDFFNNKTIANKIAIIDRAKIKSDFTKDEYNQKAILQTQQLKAFRGHQIEMHKKFTVSFACIVFLFIGAPLGAIIRKGGLGLPAVISVFLFLFYYFIDMFGAKLAKQGVLPIWEGMWMSSFILLGLGIFLTYKAVNDSVIFNAEVWVSFFKRFLGKREVRIYEKKEVIITPPDYLNDLDQINQMKSMRSAYLDTHANPNYFTFWKSGFKDIEYQNIIDKQENIIDDLLNSSENIILGKLMDYPILKVPNLKWLNRKGIRTTCMIVAPIGLIIYGIGLIKIKNKKQDLQAAIKIDFDLTHEIRNLLQRQKDIQL